MKHSSSKSISKITAGFLSILLTTGVFVSSANASETDNITTRNQVIQDSLEPLNQFVRREMLSALNRDNRSCDPKGLFERLKDKFGSTPIGQVEAWAQASRSVQKYKTSTPFGIYEGFAFFRYPILSVAGLAATIRIGDHVIGDHVIGTDKLGHFMAEGLEYFDRVSHKSLNVTQAMNWGTDTEDTYFGLQVTGVKSYADLAANLAGFHFWESILGGPKPYFECQNGRYAMIRDFNWADYITDAWDEGINCSEFTPHIEAVVEKNFKKLGLSCPVAGTESRCAALAATEHADHVVSPVCHALANKSGK